MKKIFLFICLIFLMSQSVYANNMPSLKYKNINNKDKITYNESTGTWSKSIDKKSGNYYIKTKGFGDFYDYLNSNKDFAFTTNCEYEFLYNNKLIGFSNKDLKFYDISFSDGNLTKTPLTKEEVEGIFPDYKIISISEFSPNTNAIKIKKHLHNLKIIVFNDTDNSFEDYTFSSGNAKFEQYDLQGFLTVSKAGMILFSSGNKENKGSWYVILVR